MAAENNYQTGRNTVFRSKVRSLLMKVATQKLQETGTPSAIAKIYALANEVIAEPESSRAWEQVFSMLLPAWGDITESSSDDDIFAAISAKFAAIAGVNAGDV